MADDTARSNHVRVNVVGHHGVGKTTVINRLLKKKILCPDPNPKPTENLEVHHLAARCTEETNGKKIWETDAYGVFFEDLNIQRLAQAMKPDSQNVLQWSVKVTKDTFTDELREPLTKLNAINPIDAPKGDPSDPMEREVYNLELNDNEDFLRKALHCKDKDEKEKIYMSYWDYAGHYTYYATHQLFLSPSAVYLLVVDLRKDLTDNIEGNLEFRSGALQSCTVADAVKFWAVSVQAYTKDDHGAYAPFIVVGTHRGNIKETETVERKFNDIRELLKTDLVCIAIDNTLEPVEDENLDVLRNTIIDEGRGVIDERVSSQWINLEYSMQRCKAYKDGYLKFSKLQELDKRLDFPMETAKRIEAFLCHQHDRGHLLFYHHPNLKDFIITDPMFLVNFLNLLFRRQRTSKLSRGRNEDGILNHRYIMDVAKTLQIEDSVCVNILKILVELHIMHPLDPGTTADNEDRYFLPCMLKDKPIEDQTDPDDCIESPVFQIRFAHDGIYQTTFHRIICALMKSMSVIEEEETKQIYNLYACFDVEGDELVWLVVYWKNSMINFLIKDYKKGVKPMCQYEVDIIGKFEQAIEDVLFFNKHDNSSYDFCVQCHKHDQSFLSLTELKKTEVCICKGTPGKLGGRHAVNLQCPYHEHSLGQCGRKHHVPLKEIQPVVVDVSKDHRQQDSIMLEKPSDKVLGRLARKLASREGENAHTLAIRLELPNALAKADIATRNCDGRGSEMLNILVTWRNTEETDRTNVFLLDILTRTEDYDYRTLKEAMFTLSKTDHHRFDNIPHHHNDKDITIISDHLGYRYKFVLLELGVELNHIEQELNNNNHDISQAIRQLLYQRRRADPGYLTTRKILDAMNMMELPLEPIITKLRQM